jgi:hypothetical protein
MDDANASVSTNTMIACEPNNIVLYTHRVQSLLFIIYFINKFIIFTRSYLVFKYPN